MSLEVVFKLQQGRWGGVARIVGFLGRAAELGVDGELSTKPPENRP